MSASNIASLRAKADAIAGASPSPNGAIEEPCVSAAAQKLDAAINFRGGPRLAPEEPCVVLVRGSDLTPERVNWLWEGWLALGKLGVLAGPPGSGKTTLAGACMATVTSGGRWPDGSACPVGNVLMWSGEDDPADTLLPRLIAAGADRSRVYFVTGSRVNGEVLPFDPARDLVALTAQAERIGDIRLLVVDPIVSAITGDSHKNTEVRRALQPLVDLGSYLGAAVLGITHFSKGTGGKDPTERVTGSVAFGAVARVVMVAAKVTDETGEPRRIFARSKSNIGPDDGGFEYSLEQVEAVPGIWASRVLWGKTLPGTARELLREADGDDPGADGEASALDDACAFLRSELAHGSKSAKYLFAEARNAGHSERTIKRAKFRLGIESQKESSGWVWGAPESRQFGTKGAKEAKEFTSQNLGTVGPLASNGETLAPARRCHATPEGAEDANSKRVAPSPPLAPPVASSDDEERF